MITINQAEAVDYLYRAVLDRGEDHFVDDEDSGGIKRCRYFNTNHTPQCIVGHVLADLGVDPNVLIEAGVNGVAVWDIGDVLRKDCEIDLEPGAIGALSVAQASQDRGLSWGLALQKARAYVHGEHPSGADIVWL